MDPPPLIFLSRALEPGSFLRWWTKKPPRRPHPDRTMLPEGKRASQSLARCLASCPSHVATKVVYSEAAHDRPELWPWEVGNSAARGTWRSQGWWERRSVTGVGGRCHPTPHSQDEWRFLKAKGIPKKVTASTMTLMRTARSGERTILIRDSGVSWQIATWAIYLLIYLFWGYRKLIT